ncbi:MAG TPA: cadherin-like beta sandwich domain-containing protein, partial [Verrucomicrobiaceae bacterium]
SVTFPVTIIDDAVLNGTRNVILTASATGYATGTAPLAVNDNETATLTVSVPASATEGVGTVTGTVTCSAAPATAVTVNLSSSDTTAAQVPATVIIPAGQLSVNFSITIVDDNKIDGTQTAVIRATVTNWPDEAASINVLDNENTNLALTVPSTVTEGGAAGGTVSISGILPTALTVSLASSNTSRLTVTASVTVAAGSTSAPFTLVAPNNSLTDGSASVTITATAPGFTGANATTSVLDNDVHHFAVAAIGTPQVKGVPFSVTLTAKDINNVTLGTYNGTPGLSAAGSGGADLISPTVTSAFSAGVWTGNVTVNTFDSNVVLTVSDGSGHSGASNSFNVTAGALHHFAWSTVTGTKVAGTPFSATVTAQDVASNTATNFTGTANLSGYFTNSAGSSVVITEVNPNTPDEVEFTNVSSAPVNISGWTIHLYDDTSWPSPLGAFTIPAGSTCAVGQVFRLQEFGTAPGSFPVFSFGANISWTPAASSKVAVMIRDSNGNIVDFVCVGAATPSSITLPVTVPASKWTGATVTATTSTTLDYARIGGSDGNTASDWTIAATGMGAVNPGLTLPFPAAYPAVTVAPSATGNFAAGVWTGNITVTQGATQLQLRADDGAGHTGDSNAFNVLSNDANLSALVLAGGTPSPPFNSANTSYTASVSNGTGSITVTPTASNANATLQARVNGGAYAAVSSGSPSSSLALNVGANPVDVQVTAQDGVTVKVYSVTVTRNTLYQDWTGGYGMSGINANADADYDGDGLRNLLEWGFGTDPTSDTLGMVSISGATVTSHGSPAVWVVPHGGGGADYFAMFGRRKNAAAAGLTYTVEFSADLSFWAASADTPTVLASDAEIDVVTVPFPATVNGQPARFFHVKISGP